MPRKKGVPGAATVVINPPASEQDDVPDKTVAEQEVENIMEQVDSEALTRVEARIFRRHPATGNKETLTDTVDAELVTAENLRDNYGGGSFRVQFIGPMPGKAGKPGRGIMKVLRFDIDPAIPPKHPRAALAGASEQHAPHSSGGSSALDMAVVSMLTTMMSNMNAQQQQAAESNRALATMQMNMMRDHSAMLAAQLAELSKGRSSDRDPFDMVKDIAALIKPEPTRSLRDELETLQMLREITGDRDSETNWMDVVRDVAPSLLQAVGRNGAVPEGRAVRGARRVEPPAAPVVHSGPIRSGPPAISEGASEAPAEGVQSTGDGGVNNPNLKFVAPIIPRLLKMASQGRPAELCAAWILSEVPEGLWPMLREQLSRDTLLDEVTAAFPDAGPIRPWISEFRDAMLAQMEPEPDDDDDDDFTEGEQVE